MMMSYTYDAAAVVGGNTKRFVIFVIRAFVFISYYISRFISNVTRAYRTHINIICVHTYNIIIIIIIIIIIVVIRCCPHIIV